MVRNRFSGSKIYILFKKDQLIERTQKDMLQRTQKALALVVLVLGLELGLGFRACKEDGWQCRRELNYPKPIVCRRIFQEREHEILLSKIRPKVFTGAHKASMAKLLLTAFAKSPS